MSYSHTIVVEEVENRAFAALFGRQALDLARTGAFSIAKALWKAFPKSSSDPLARRSNGPRPGNP